VRPFILFSASPAHFLVQSIHGRKPENSRPRFKMLGPIPERECQIPELGPTDEIQNYLHGSANADDPFGVMETIVVCPELIATLPSVRAVMCVKTLANHTEVTCILMIIWESYPLCCHKSELLVVSDYIHDRNSRAVVQALPSCNDLPRTLQFATGFNAGADASPQP
jgi:hypothetical protein